MNLLDCTVLEVIGEPFNAYEKWFIKVTFECYGKKATSDLMFDTREECLDVKEGYIFQA